MRIGVVSDTHDRLPAGLLPALDGVEEILHAGDVVSSETLSELEAVAPVVAVRGNMDQWELASTLPERRLLERGAIEVALLHGHRQRRGEVDDFLDAYRSVRPRVVIFGHSHTALSEVRQGIHFFNPGTAGGIGAEATIGILTIEGGDFTLEHLAV